MLEDLSPGQRIALYCEKFGDKRGMRWFLEGRSFLECLERLADELSAIPYLETQARHLRKQVREDRFRFDLADSVTRKISAGRYRVQVLLGGHVLLESTIVKNCLRNRCWSVLWNPDAKIGSKKFKTLAEARDYCIRRSVKS